jgi:GNAT superfamily N-acetyltransferase
LDSNRILQQFWNQFFIQLMHIKQATLDDLEDLLPLFDAYRVFYKKESNLPATRKFLTERILQNESIVYLIYTVREDSFGEGVSEAVGFTQIYPVYSSVRLSRMWLLNDLFVQPAHRGKGLSKALIEKTQDLARKTGAVGVTLQTAKDNLVGNQLYPATGFEIDDNNFYFWANPDFVI